ncbi:LOW QUALITY PROTEIN: retinol dehydrogenase 8 [Aplochiton taeniatus]
MATSKVLVTGCSSGIGLAVAARLAKDERKRFRVIATMRDLGKRGPLERAAGAALNRTLEIKELDACSETSIRECVDSLPDRRVDVLVNNAGVGMIGPLECQSVDDMQELFNTNFFGLVRLLKEVLPDMKRRQKGHIVVMSSVMGIQGLLFNDVYAASKFAVEGFCESLAVQALKFNIKTTLVEPGPVATEFERKLLSQTPDEVAEASVQIIIIIKNYIYIFFSLRLDINKKYTKGLIHWNLFIQQTVRVITAKDPPLRHQTNRLYMPMTALKHADPSGRLPLNTFYQMLFKHDRVFKASLGLMRLLQKRMGKASV